ncbi:MAG: GyrI-like domain-containing protein [Acetobacteraceae bacterium]|nr:GyrI-like domain-containing protein [Acetobacteraceae bacterium]
MSQGEVGVAAGALPYRITRKDSLHLMGVEDCFTPNDSEKIAGLWRRFMVRHVEIPNAINQPPLALARILGPDTRFDYLCAMQITAPTAPPNGMIQRSLPPAEYAVFRHAGPVTSIGQTYDRIFNAWPVPGRHFQMPPVMLELFLPKFDPATGDGGVEIWVTLVPDEQAR